MSSATFSLPKMAAIKPALAKLVFGDNEDSAAPQPIVRHPSQLTSLTSLSSLLPYDEYDPSNGLFYNDDSISFIFEVVPQTGASEQMEERLSSLFNPLPPNTCYQWSLFGGPMSYERMDTYLDQRRIAADRNAIDPLLLELCKKRVEFFKRSKGRGLFLNDNFSIRDFRLVLSVTREANRDNPRDVSDMADLRDTLRATLNSAQLPAFSMDAEGFVNFMAPLTDPRIMFDRETRDHFPYDSGKSIKDQMGTIGMPCTLTGKSIIWGFDNDDDGADQISARVFTVRSYPKTKRLWEMLNLVGAVYDDNLQYPCPFLITQGVQTQERTKTEETHKFKGARAQMNAESKMAKFQTELRDVNADYLHMQQHIDAGGQQVMMYHNVVLFAPPSQMRRYEATVENIWAAERFKIVRCDSITMPMFVASLPMTLTPKVSSALRRPAKVTSRKTDRNATNTSPVLAEWQGSGDPVLLFFGKRGGPTFIDLYSNKEGNYNFAVTGVSGSGKSVLIQEIVSSYRSIGSIVRIIDVGRAYENLIKMQNGVFLQFDRRKMPCLNPFTNVGRDEENSFEHEMRFLKPLISRMASPNRPLEPFQSSLMEQAITEVWKDYGQDSNPDKIAKFLLTIKDENGNNERYAYELSKQLYPFTERGQFGSIFNGKADLVLEGPMIGLELEELASVPDLRRVVMFAVTQLITHDMYLLPRNVKKMCVMDEGWQLLGDDAETGAFIEEGYRRARKYEGIFGLGTQGIGDFFKTAAGRAAYSNADWKIIGRQEEDTLSRLVASKEVAFDPAMVRMINALRKEDGKYSEWLISSPAGKAVVKCILDPWFLTMASSKGPVFERVRHHITDGGLSTLQAINEVVREQGFHV